MGSGGTCHYCQRSPCVCGQGFTAEELTLIRQLLEERIEWAKRSQCHVRNDMGWRLVPTMERETKLGDLALAQKLAESALRSLERLEHPPAQG